MIDANNRVQGELVLQDISTQRNSMLRNFGLLLHNLDNPEALRKNPVFRRLFPGEMTALDFRKLREGIELNLLRLSERERTILLRHDIGRESAEAVRQPLYISSRQFTAERRRGLIRLFEYVIGDFPASLNFEATILSKSTTLRVRAMREKDIVTAP